MTKLARLLLVLVFLSTAAGALPAAASDPPPPPESPLGETRIMLPFVVKPYPYLINGQVTDQNAVPLSGVTITDQLGHVTTTSPSGDYSLGVTGGVSSLAPSLEGYLFSPPVIDLNVSSNVTGQDFSASAACSEAIGDPGFETGGYWNLLEGLGYYPSSYSSTVVHSGARSVRVGIVNPADNSLSDSLVRSQSIYVPYGSAATLQLWLYPLSGETPMAAPEAVPPDSDFGDATLLYDAQFVRVLNSSNAVIGTLLYIRSNNAFWTYHRFDLSAYAGQTIKIEIGVYNDGTSGVTGLYADDVSLQLCDSVPPPPPPPDGDCSNQVLNSSFEYNGSWGIPYTPYPAGYSADYAYHGVRSMRTGIPLYSYSNVYSYSDAWQTIYVPAQATSALLHLWLYPRSEEAALTTDAAAPDPEPASPPPAVGTIWEEQPLGPEAFDAQYVLLLDPSTGAILETLLWWQPRNAPGWIRRDFDLSRYAGRSIRLQFGTYNNGYGGRTVMYVDQVILETCATPPPPPVCSERIANGGFENTSAWYIPLTQFSAGYSTALAHNGWRSMRTGIVYTYHNRYSYSDFRQAVSIPVGTSNATLRFYAYSMSGEVYGSETQVERPTAAELGAEAMAGDVQYLLVLDGWGNWLDTLLWQRSNTRYWSYFQYNLSRFIGSTIQLQWGTYNNGWDGVTSMYVDDVSLQACP
jgi:hypothetical protein